MPKNVVQDIPAFGAISDIASGNVQPIWLNWFNSVFRFLRLAPTIYTGILPPTSTPTKVGDTFVDTIAKKIYVSVGTTSAADWIILN